MSELPEGYSVPVYRSLTQPVLVAGVPKRLAVTLGMTAALVVPIVFLKPGSIFYVAVIEFVIYAIYAFASARCRTDPQYFEVFFQNRGPRRLVP